MSWPRDCIRVQHSGTDQVGFVSIEIFAAFIGSTDVPQFILLDRTMC